MPSWTWLVSYLRPGCLGGNALYLAAASLCALLQGLFVAESVVQLAEMRRKLKEELPAATLPQSVPLTEIPCARLQLEEGERSDTSLRSIVQSSANRHAALLEEFSSEPSASRDYLNETLAHVVLKAPLEQTLLFLDELPLAGVRIRAAQVRTSGNGNDVTLSVELGFLCVKNSQDAL